MVPPRDNGYGGLELFRNETTRPLRLIVMLDRIEPNLTGDHARQRQSAPSAAERRAVEDLFLRRRSKLVGLATLITSDPAAAEDVVQECFARLSERSRSIDNLEGYVRTAVSNAAVSWLRSQASYRRRVQPTPPGAIDEHLVEFRDLLFSLTDNQRIAIVGRFFADLDDETLAEAIGCRPATVRSHIARGLKRLRGAMA